MRRRVKLGGDRGVKITAKARKLGNDANERAADAMAANIAPVIKELQAAGAELLRAIAAGLNAAASPLRGATVNGPRRR
jgi:hypothetical protein